MAVLDAAPEDMEALVAGLHAYRPEGASHVPLCGDYHCVSASLRKGGALVICREGEIFRIAYVRHGEQRMCLEPVARKDVTLMQCFLNTCAA